MVCGYTPAQISDLDMEEAESIFRYLQRHPSVHELMAGWVGWKAPAQSEAMSQDDPSVRLGNSILAGIEAAQKAEPPRPQADMPLPQMFPGGMIRM